MKVYYVRFCGEHDGCADDWYNMSEEYCCGICISKERAERLINEDAERDGEKILSHDGNIYSVTSPDYEEAWYEIAETDVLE